MYTLPYNKMESVWDIEVQKILLKGKNVRKLFLSMILLKIALPNISNIGKISILFDHKGLIRLKFNCY